MKFDTTIKLLCDYCGEECSDTNEVVIDDVNYCCYGCATLSKVASGTNFNPTEVSLKYKQLDFQDTFNSLVDYQDDSVYGITISLPNIQCSSCIRLIEDLPSLNDDVLSSRVNFEKKVCKLIVRKSLALSFLAQLIDDIGYPPLISISQKQKIESDHFRFFVSVIYLLRADIQYHLSIELKMTEPKTFEQLAYKLSSQNLRETIVHHHLTMANLR